MNTNISGNVFIVTGAGAGIGQALTQGLTAQGAIVVAVDVDQAALDALVAEAPAGSVMAAHCDVSDDSRVEAVVAETDGRFGRIDVLVNNAVINHAVPLIELEPSQWRKIIDVNLTGAFLFARAAVPHMIKRQHGIVINITSALGVRGAPKNSAYAATKAAMINLTNTLYQEVYNHGIRVHAIAPGLMDTAHARESVNDEHLARVAATYPGGKLGLPTDLVDLVQFLSSPAGAAMSGGTTIFLKP